MHERLQREPRLRRHQHKRAWAEWLRRSGGSHRMLNQIFPQRLDNTYRGHPLALWLFMPVVVFKTGIALGTYLQRCQDVRSFW